MPGRHPDYLPAVRAWCDQQHLLLILDEVQTGVGRCGTLWGHQLFGVEPDIMTAAKGLGGGVPIGVLLAKEHASAFEPGDHASTFGGNPVSCAAACAVVDAIDDELLAHVRSLSAYLRVSLAAYGEMRGLGLLLGLELDRPAAPVVATALERGLVIGSAGERTLRLTPPLTLTTEEAAQGLELLTEVLS